MPYLTTADYIARFTQAEAVRIAQQGNTGQPDEPKISKAIADASLFADAYLGGRYLLPIDPAPELLRKVVADLAREDLHTTRPTQSVTENADRARALLKDLQAGRATIPAPAMGEAPAENPSDLGAASHDRRVRVFTDANLADFTGFGGSYGGTVFDSGPRNW